MSVNSLTQEIINSNNRRAKYYSSYDKTKEALIRDSMTKENLSYFSKGKVIEPNSKNQNQLTFPENDLENASFSQEKTEVSANSFMNDFSVSANIYNSTLENKFSTEICESQDNLKKIFMLQRENLWLKNELANKDVLIEKFKQSEHQANLFLSIIKKLLFKNNVWERDYFQFIKIFEFAIDYCKSFKFFYIETNQRVDQVKSNEIVYKLLQLLEKVKKGYSALKVIGGSSVNSSRKKSGNKKGVKSTKPKAKKKGLRKKIKYMQIPISKVKAPSGIKSLSGNSKRIVNVQRQKINPPKLIKPKMQLKKKTFFFEEKKSKPFRPSQEERKTPIKKIISFDNIHKKNPNTFTFQKIDNNLLESGKNLDDDNDYEVLTSLRQDASNLDQISSSDFDNVFKQPKKAKKKEIMEKENTQVNRKKFIHLRKLTSDMDSQGHNLLKKKKSKNKVLFSQRQSLLSKYQFKYDTGNINNSLDVIKQRLMKKNGLTPQINKQIFPKSTKKLRLSLSQCSSKAQKKSLVYKKTNPYPFIIKKSIQRVRKGTNFISMIDHNFLK